MMKRVTFKLASAFSLLLLLLTSCTNKIAVLDPQGPVAREEYRLIIWSTILVSLILAVVIILFIYVLVRFGKKNHNHYEPNNDGNTKLEIIWTVIPIIIVILLSVPTVKVLMDLDKPPKATAASAKPLTIHVTSVQWKWLFRYPDQKIETVNYAAIPAGTPVKFVLHAHDAMNSFWVPQLGGQMYTMPDMPMKLWLQADHPGNYLGRSANYSGRGFAGMEFHILSKSRTDFNSWVKDVKATKPALSTAKYKQLLIPDNVGTMTFSSYPKSLDKENNAEMKNMKGMSKGSQHKEKDIMKGMDMSGGNTKGGKDE